MRDQYAGDVTDVAKVALLRRLTGAGHRLGVAWYYVTGHDGGTDGTLMGWAADPGWESLDPSAARAVAHLPARSVAALQAAAVWPAGTAFHGAPVPSDLGARREWAAEMRAALADADIVFADPDNGVGATAKHATPTELRKLRAPGRTVIVIGFPGRSGTHAQQLERLHGLLADEADATSVHTLQLALPVARADRLAVRHLWFTLMDAGPDHLERLRQFATDLCAALPRSHAQVIG